MYSFRPDLVEIKTDQDGFVQGYNYRAKTKKYFPKDEVCHIKTPHPSDDYYGLSYFLPATKIADILALTETWNLKLLQNDMRPPGVLQYEGTMPKAKADELRHSFEEALSGASNAGRSVILEGGLKWQSAGMSPREADWLSLIKVYLRQVAAIFDIPSELLGDSENKTYSNMKEARKAFYLETVLPFCDYIVDEFNRSVLPKWIKNAWLEIDRNNIELIQDDLSEKARLVGGLGFLTINEKRAFMGYPPVPGGDVIIGSLSDVALLSSSESTKKNKELKSHFWADRQRKSVLWSAHKRRTDRMTEKFFVVARSFFRQLSKEIAEKINTYPSVSLVQADKILEQREFLELYKKNFSKLYKEFLLGSIRAGVQAARKDILAIVEEKEDNKPLAWSDEFEKEAERLVTETCSLVAKDIVSRVKDMIQEGQSSSQSVGQLAQNIWDAIEEFSASRARLWAQTECTKIDNFGQLQGYKISGVEMKGWLCSMLPTSRASHIEADERYSENPIPVDEYFEVDGERLAYPGDPAGSPGNVCNCHCTILPFVMEE